MAFFVRNIRYVRNYNRCFRVAVFSEYRRISVDFLYIEFSYGVLYDVYYAGIYKRNGGSQVEKYSIRNLNFYYPERSEKSLDNISLSVEKGGFTVICGASGCGKSTLLRQLKTVLTPHGTRNGEIFLDGIPLENLDSRKQASEIGFVSQSPDNQIVTDKVWHELAFGLESLGVDTASIRARVAEMASFFGIQNWFHKKTTELSGGQKQLLNLASVMVMQPSVIILDEPTSQLDPIASSDFLAVLAKINRELGVTVILTEHRLEEALPFATDTVVMDKGKIICSGTVQEVGKKLREYGHSMFLAMPTAMRIWSAVENSEECPVTVRDGSIFLSKFAEKNSLHDVPEKNILYNSGNIVLETSDVWFRYEKDSQDIVKGLKIKLHEGEFLAILGGNGSGKTTSLKVIASLKKHYRGEIKYNGKIGFLPQNPQSLFVKKTVYEDLREVFRGVRISETEKEKIILQTTSICRIENLLDRHPYDLSGGEQQRTALAKILLCEPDILLLDEPTKGIDAEFKEVFAEILNDLLSTGKSVLMVRHDIEFCAEYADRCAMFFDGEITSQGTPEEFFSGNSFYTTSASRMSRHVINNAVTVNDVISACGGKSKPYVQRKPLANQQKETAHAEKTIKKLPLCRKIIACISGIFSVVVFFYSVGITDLTKIINSDGLTELSKNQIYIYMSLIVSLFVTALAVGKRSEIPLQIQQEKRKLSKRTATALITTVITIPVTLFTSIFYLDHKLYNIISIAILLECMIPFFIVFEGRKPKARELVVIAVLCALGVAGRASFFMLPQFNPVMTITIISGVAFGGETGFLVGAVTMLASNMIFSQGPWTPWQMFSMGLTGFFAGIFFRKGILRHTRISLCIYGAIVSIVIYGGIMNASSAFIQSTEALTKEVIIAYYLTGFPIDCIQSFSTVFFLYFTSEPMLEKIDRIKVK
ncbi:MAG: ATP-binding cassette domain-containing protein [Ruminococcus sp.]|nr:ATP-binding cassette domain-containing protein [Ruminococcus sp.]